MRKGGDGRFCEEMRKSRNKRKNMEKNKNDKSYTEMAEGKNTKSTCTAKIFCI